MGAKARVQMVLGRIIEQKALMVRVLNIQHAATFGTLVVHVDHGATEFLDTVTLRQRRADRSELTYVIARAVD